MAGTLLNIKPILEIEGGEVVPVKRVRGAHKAFMEFVEAFEAGPSTGRRSASGSPMRTRRSASSALEELVRRTRPQAQIEVETMLGAVVGTHAGPGCVGFFWFDD